MSFSAIRENKNLAKISRFTVHVFMKGQILRLVPKVILDTELKALAEIKPVGLLIWPTVVHIEL